MLVTLGGRIQTRIFILLTVGLLVTLVVTPFLPARGPLGSAYGVTLRVLVAVLVLGVLWELLYHGLQQFRWEKDWPTFFGLITAVNEGLLIWLALTFGLVPGVGEVPGITFLLDFTAVWLITWLCVNGPMRVPFIHWRFRGGRLI